MVNGTAFEGTWQAECPISSDTVSQTYAFNYNCVDTGGHNTYNLIKEGFDVSGGPNAEYDSPIIEKITTADTTTAGTMLDVYLTLADESGISTSSYVNVHQTSMFAVVVWYYVVLCGVSFILCILCIDLLLALMFRWKYESMRRKGVCAAEWHPY
jgi:hypothetical protein